MPESLITCCTGCGQCRSCPMELDIPTILGILNANQSFWKAAEKIRALPEQNQPGSCVGCGHCASVCPEHVDVPGCMLRLTGLLRTGREAV